MTYKIDRLVKLATEYEERAELEARAWVQLAIGIAMIAAPFVSEIVDQIKATSDIPSDVDRALSNLTDYKSTYGFDKYDSQFTEFMTACQQLKDSFNVISRNTDPANPELLSNIQKFMESSGKVEQLGFAIKGYLDEMKGGAGKFFDVMKKFKMNLGIDTDATAAGDAIDALYKHIAMSRPKFETLYKDLTQKVQEAQKSGTPATPEATKTKAPPTNKLEELADITF